MHKEYRRLREEDRGVIYRMNRAGKRQKCIAQAIGFSQSAVSKELLRNKGKRGYRPKQAHRKATQRQEFKRTRPLLIVGDLKERIDELLGKKHSPEQISGQLKKKGIQVSRESIYAYIVEDKQEGGLLYKELRINGRRRGYLLSLYERKIHLGKLVYLKTKGARETSNAIINTLKFYKVKTLTYDNGLEFAEHVRVSHALRAKGFFCQSYHSWEKGGVENFNGLVRQYYPKGSSFKSISSSTLRRVEDEINQRPRKTLEYTAPSQLETKLAA